MTPITRVVDEDGAVLHDCELAGCEVSWDGYVLATGEPTDSRRDPGDGWDTSTPGVAKRISSDG